MQENLSTPRPKFFCFYESYGLLLSTLSDAQAGRLIKAMYAKFYEDKPMEIKGPEGSAFILISYQLESDRRRYQNVCERNRKNSQSRRKKRVEEDPLSDPVDATG